MPRFRGHDKRAFKGGPYFGLKIALNSPYHFFARPTSQSNEPRQYTAYLVVPPGELRRIEPVKCYLPFVSRLRKGATMLIAWNIRMARLRRDTARRS
jgi:hypothetical protein